MLKQQRRVLILIVKKMRLDRVESVEAARVSRSRSSWRLEARGIAGGSGTDADAEQRRTN